MEQKHHIWTYDVFIDSHWVPLDHSFRNPYKRKKKFINFKNLSPEDKNYYYRYPSWFFFDTKRDEDFLVWLHDNRNGHIFEINIYDLWIYADESVIIKTKATKKKNYQRKLHRKKHSSSKPRLYLKTIKNFNEDIKDTKKQGFKISSIPLNIRQADTWDIKFRKSERSWKAHRKTQYKNRGLF